MLSRMIALADLISNWDYLSIASQIYAEKEPERLREMPFYRKLLWLKIPRFIHPDRNTEQ